jgi:hypothetical protein
MKLWHLGDSKRRAITEGLGREESPPFWTTKTQEKRNQSHCSNHYPSLEHKAYPGITRVNAGMTRDGLYDLDVFAAVLTYHAKPHHEISETLANSCKTRSDMQQTRSKGRFGFPLCQLRSCIVSTANRCWVILAICAQATCFLPETSKNTLCQNSPSLFENLGEFWHTVFEPRLLDQRT